MILKQKNTLLFFQFPNLVKFSEIRHAVFTRDYGYSRGPYRSLNVGFGVGDDSSHVRRNRQAILECMQGKEVVFAQQVHGSDVLVVADDNKENINKSSDLSLEGDAIVTDLPGKMLLIQVADCQAVLMYDPVKRVVANVHSGWRGSIKNIIGRTIEVMKRDFGSLPCDIIAGIGPSLGPCCAEFINYKKEIPKAFWVYKDASDHFDFWSISKDQLCRAGLLMENIYAANLCTRCNTDLFFSFRNEGRTGRFAAVIGLSEANHSL